MRSSISASEYGRLAETLAATWLRLRGYRILGRNVRVAGREVDVVAKRGQDARRCEVKARRSASRGTPAEAVGAQKSGGSPRRGRCCSRRIRAPSGCGST